MQQRWTLAVGPSMDCEFCLFWGMMFDIGFWTIVSAVYVSIVEGYNTRLLHINSYHHAITGASHASPHPVAARCLHAACSVHLGSSSNFIFALLFRTGDGRSWVHVNSPSPSLRIFLPLPHDHRGLKYQVQWSPRLKTGWWHAKTPALRLIPPKSGVPIQVGSRPVSGKIFNHYLQ